MCVNERFNFVGESSFAEPVAADGTAPAGATLGYNNLQTRAPKNGYCYIYLSNQANEAVFFDNLKVHHERSRIIEENHYYAYGLKIAAISSRKLADPAEGQIANQFLYNAKELWEDANLDWYDYGFRNYDAQIGRFVQLDPLASSFPWYSPYHYAGCEPISNIDMDGLEPFSVIGATVQAQSRSGDYHAVVSFHDRPRMSPAAYENLTNFSINVNVQVPTWYFAPSADATRVSRALLPVITSQWQIDPQILMPDITGHGHIGRKSIVEPQVSRIAVNYRNAVGENMQGFFGSLGYVIGGDRGSFAGRELDNVLTAGEFIRGQPNITFAKGIYIPEKPLVFLDREFRLPQQKVNLVDIPLPDPQADGYAHTTLGGRLSNTGLYYRQSATFTGGKSPWRTANGFEVPWSRVDWYDHSRIDHDVPHQRIFNWDVQQKRWIASDNVPFGSH